MNSSRPMRFCIFKLGAIGDLLFALPNVRALKTATTESSSITWIVEEDLAPIPALVPEINQVFLLEREFYGGTAWTRIRLALALRKRLPRQFDGILLLHRHWGYLLALIGKGPVYRIARPPKAIWGRALSTLLSKFCDVHSIEYPPMSRHESEAIQAVTAAMLARLGLHSKIDWKMTPDDLRFPSVHPQLPSAKDMILIHLGGGQNVKSEFILKRWPGMSDLVKQLLHSRTERIGIVGANSERKQAEALVQELGYPDRLISYAGRTTLTQLVSMIAECKMLIGPDSGPVHIADSLGVPCLAVFGPTSEVSWGVTGPLAKTVQASTPCRPCYKDDGKFPECHHAHICMRSLSPHEVLIATENILRTIDHGPFPTSISLQH